VRSARAPALALAALLVLAALVAGCGGGSTTVIERTVTEKVEVPAKGEGGSGAQENTAATVACSQEVGYGQGLEVPAGGEAGFVCAGDTALDPTASSLAYGTASRVGGSECISRTDGITCVDWAGHGFFISIQSYQVF
jgi:hypothetical protein